MCYEVPIHVYKQNYLLILIADWWFQFNNYCLIILNDDIHTNQHVANMVMIALGKNNCTTKQAQDLTQFIDKEGRAVLKVGTYQVCLIVILPSLDPYDYVMVIFRSVLPWERR